MVVVKKPFPVSICTDSWEIQHGLTLWISSWKVNQWLVGHRAVWEQGVSQDLWEVNYQKSVTLYYVTEHDPLASPGNGETDTLAKLHWLDLAPQSGFAEWLHWRLLHAGQKTM